MSHHHFSCFTVALSVYIGTGKGLAQTEQLKQEMTNNFIFCINNHTYYKGLSISPLITRSALSQGQLI